MILTIEAAVLAKAVARVRSVTGDPKSIPILANVLLVAEGGLLRITATDNTIQISEEVPCDVQEPGKTTVLASRLHDALRYLPGAASVLLKLTDEDPRMILQCARSRFQLPTLPANMFPLVFPDTGKITATIDTDALTRLIDKTAFSAGTDAVRDWLNGVHFHTLTEDDALTFRAVATDGHRMAIADMEAPEGMDLPVGVTLPNRTVAELRKLLDGAGETVEMSLSDSKACFNLGAAQLISKVLGSAYPDYKRVIPPTSPNTLKVENGLLSGCLKRAMVVSTEKSRSVAMDIDGGKVTLLARDQEAGEAREELEGDLVGDGVHVRFNAGYLLAISDRIKGEIAVLNFGDAKAPFLITDPGDRFAQFILVPQLGN